ncbi:hypothetical protein BJF85_02185 [Saccharomonospora sp. CUA-673]|uniref:helix-turn-helix domain-containing protein n=1 Tax=Saccharomonospora sp. CUA-673 TaxID=1904969 RepID=UPI00095F34BC|nr:helix-turn-helix transcriptional regulator [Saccharomonospora sp. CUA-673]OLT45215.1 hypothetical protein BJF85_02185 [Saccharomonospora sp. CUA-673]
MADGGNRRHPPNKRLTWERLQRGWSRDELVNQVAESMRAHGDGESGLTAHTVRRWESGERWPEPRFRKHLVLIFDLPASELGLLTPEEREFQPQEVTVPSGALDAMVSAELRRLLMSERGGLGRQQFLRAAVAAGLSPLLASVAVGEADAAWNGRGHARDPRAVESYANATAAQRALYWTTPAETMWDAALGHLRLGLTLLGQTTTSREGDDPLAAAVAETALLAARIAFFDLGNPAVATRCFEQAESTVDYAGDHALAAAIAAHRAFVPGFAGDGVAAQRHLDVAQAHARFGGGPNLRAWLHCVTAEVHARTGQGESSRERIRQAEHALGTNGTDPEWLDFFSPARLASFAGNAELLAGRHEAAARWLDRSLAELDPQADKQRAVVLLDLAAAHAPTDAEHAASFAHRACDMLSDRPYGAAVERIPAVQQALAGTPAGVELVERTRALRLPAVAVD